MSVGSAVHCSYVAVSKALVLHPIFPRPRKLIYPLWYARLILNSFELVPSLIVCPQMPQKTLVSALDSSRLDYCKSLLSGFLQCLLNKVQKLQHNVAPLVRWVPKPDHISPHLAPLHWLPIDSRIRYKLASLYYNCPRAHKRLCERRGGRPALPVPNKPHGFWNEMQLPQLYRSCLLDWTPESLQTNQPATLFFWSFHSLSSLCVHALAWSEILFLCCTVCLEQSPLQSKVIKHTHIFQIIFEVSPL